MLMRSTDDSETAAPVLPPDTTIEGRHHIGQDSPVKGLRIVEMTWLPKLGCWQWEKFRYGAAELARNHWIYLDAVPSDAPAATP